MTRRLTQKQKIFCQRYFVLGNATEAALLAGYSSRAIRSIASENLTKPNIKQYLDELNKKTEDESVGTVRERKQILTEIYRGRMGNFLDEEQHIKQGEPMNSAAIQEITTEEVKIGRGEHAQLVQITKIKLINPIQAIAEHNKMGGDYAPEKHAVMGDIVIEVIYVNRGNNKNTGKTANPALPSK